MSHQSRIELLKHKVKTGDSEAAEALKVISRLDSDAVYSYFMRIYLPFDTPHVYREKMTGYQDKNVVLANQALAR